MLRKVAAPTLNKPHFRFTFRSTLFLPTHRSFFGRNMTHQQSLLNNTIEYVKKELSGNDASHDWAHIERVWKLAKEISKTETVDEEIVELAALLHDIQDWKYSGR